jgi:hypothetical protein
MGGGVQLTLSATLTATRCMRARVCVHGVTSCVNHLPARLI